MAYPFSDTSWKNAFWKQTPSHFVVVVVIFIRHTHHGRFGADVVSGFAAGDSKHQRRRETHNFLAPCSEVLLQGNETEQGMEKMGTALSYPYFFQEPVGIENPTIGWMIQIETKRD